MGCIYRPSERHSQARDVDENCVCGGEEADFCSRVGANLGVCVAEDRGKCPSVDAKEFLLRALIACEHRMKDFFYPKNPILSYTIFLSHGLRANMLLTIV